MVILSDDDNEFMRRFVKSFKLLGGTRDGLIDYESFKSHLHEVKLDEGHILQNIDEEKFVISGKLDYFKLCASLLARRLSFKSVPQETKQAKNYSVSRDAFTNIKSNHSDVLSNSSETRENNKDFKQNIRGCLFRLNGDLFSNQYHLEIFENSDVEIRTKPFNFKDMFNSNAIIDVLLFQDKYKTFVLASNVDTRNSCSMKCHLKRGKYIIIPIFLSWPVKEICTNEQLSLSSLVESQSDDQIILSPACHEILKMIFHAIDLDGNGLLNQLEFDVFIQHTSGETASDEWLTIEDNFEVRDHQLTFDGFIELYKMVLKTDPSDMINMLQQMGINHHLQPENAQPFYLNIESNSGFHVTSLFISSYSTAAEKGLTKIALKKGYCKKIKQVNDLFLFIYKQPHRITIVVQNQSHNEAKVGLNCSESENCRSHRNTLDYTVELSAQTSVIGHHLFPVNPAVKMKVNCTTEVKS